MPSYAVQLDIRMQSLRRRSIREGKRIYVVRSARDPEQAVEFAKIQAVDDLPSEKVRTIYFRSSSVRLL